MAREREPGRGIGAHPLLVPYVVLAHVVILTVVFWRIYTSIFSDVPIYYDYASKLLAGQVPYLDFAMEYPPAALVWFVIPRLVSHTVTQYYVAFRVEVVAADLLVVFALNAIARRRGLDRAAVLIAYTVFVLTVGPIIGQDYDIFPAAVVVFALFFAVRDEWNAAAVMLGIGIATKLYPMLLGPILALPLVRRRELRLLARCVVVGCATIVMSVAPLLIAAPASILSMVRYHAARGIHVESTYGSLLVLADKLRLTRVNIDYNFASWNVSGAAAAALKPLTSLFLLAGVVTVYVAALRASVDDSSEDPASVATWSTLALSVALLTSKVLSPQYLIWLMPLVPLVAPSARRTVWPLFGLAGLATYYIFPRHYMALVVSRDDLVVAALLLRNLVLVVMTLMLVRCSLALHTRARPRVSSP